MKWFIIIENRALAGVYSFSLTTIWIPAHTIGALIYYKIAQTANSQKTITSINRQ